jgi:hypothetical protein
MNTIYRGIGILLLSAIFASIALGQPNGSELKIDLSRQIASEASGLAGVASEKKALGLKWLDASRELDNFKIFNQYDFEIKSFRYAGENLFVSYSARLNKEKARASSEKIKFIQEFAVSILHDKKTSVANHAPNKNNVKDMAKGIAAWSIGGSVGSNSVAIYFLDENGKEVAKQEAPISDIQKLIRNWASLLDNAEPYGIYIDFESTAKITRQDAAKIKSIKIDNFHKMADGTVDSLGRKWATRININPLLASLNSNDPINSYEVARDGMMLELINNFREFIPYQRHYTASKDTKTLNHLYLWHAYAIARAYVADSIVAFSILQNSTDPLLLAFAADHSSMFDIEILASIIDGKRHFSAKSGSSNTNGCENYIPKDYQYAQNGSMSNPSGNNNVNLFLSQMGLLNNTAILGEPDKKTRVIVGAIESLTSDGGIIRNTGKNQDEKPIVYTRSSKSVVINPEKISVGTAMIRIVGTYEKNSKVQLSNRLGGSRIVDAADISVVCMEPLYNDTDLLKMLFGN